MTLGRTRLAEEAKLNLVVVLSCHYLTDFIHKTSNKIHQNPTSHLPGLPGLIHARSLLLFQQPLGTSSLPRCRKRSGKISAQSFKVASRAGADHCSGLELIRTWNPPTGFLGIIEKSGRNPPPARSEQAEDLAVSLETSSFL